MVKDYKLTYFNLRVLGEPIRYVLLAADQPWEDERVEVPDWAAVKKTLKWGQLPILTYGGGKKMTQSTAIAEFLAKKFGFAPEDAEGQARCNEIVQHVQDCRTKWVPFYWEFDSEKREVIRKNLVENVFPAFLANIDELIAENGGKYVYGKKVTWADFYVANFAELWRDSCEPTLLDKYPNLQKQIETVNSIPQIKDWIDNKRPNGNLFGFVI